MIKIFLLSMLIIAIAFALLAVKLLFLKNGKFTSQHIHDNAALRKQGIHCVIDQDKEARRTVTSAVSERSERSAQCD